MGKKVIPFNGFLCLIFIPVFILSSATIVAEPLAEEDVPDALKPWIKWVLHNEEKQECPFLYNKDNDRRCQWSAVLKLIMNENGARFSQQWLLFDKGWVILPGSDELWPQEIKINGEGAVLGKKGNFPALYLDSGKYLITGRFNYDDLPESLTLSAETGLIDLKIKGKKISFPNLDNMGRLWLKDGAQEEKTDNRQDRLQLTVNRLVQDDIPLVMITRIELMVSGKHREIHLGRVISSNFMPMSIESVLPARLEPDGSLRVQARPGKWTISLKARHLGPVSALTCESPSGLWASEEVWAFEARNHLRIVAIEGPVQVDPQQTTLPSSWRRFPAYLMSPGDKMQLVEKRRGDIDPAPDQLQLNRSLWLDFNGLGYSIKDRITGTMTSDWRLEMSPPIALGRVMVDGKEQFITRLRDDGQAGVEVRMGQLDLEADSRLEGDITEIPAVGWSKDFNALSGSLHLPPGWSLFDASGIDNINDTWLRRWALIDLFLVVIISLATARLWGWPWGIVCLLTMVLIAHETNAPRWLWLVLMANMALLRLLPTGKVKTAFKYVYLACIGLLIMISLPFMVAQIRTGLFPQLQRPRQEIGLSQKQVLMKDRVPVKAGRKLLGAFREEEARETDEETIAPPSALQQAVPMAEDKRRYKMDAYPKGSRSSSELPYQSRQEPWQQFDPEAQIQTGAGIPSWRWHTIPLEWNGPVARGQKISFAYISPRVSSILAFLRVVFLALLISCVAGVGYRPPADFDFSRFKRFFASVAGVMTIIFFALTSVPQAHADFPDSELLKELKIKLLDKEPPPCLPHCAVSSRMRIQTTPNALRLRQEIACHEDVSVPLPGHVMQWMPNSVLVDGEPLSWIYRHQNGHLWLYLTKGRHQVVLSGPMPARDSVQLPLPLRPHYVQAEVSGWTLEGLHENGQVSGQLQFDRIKADNEEDKADTLEPGRLPPFVHISRRFNLDLNWQVVTTVKRITPRGTAVVLALPLLEGESVTTEGVRVEDGRVLVNMAAYQQQLDWVSSFKERDTLVLKAGDAASWMESWHLNISPIWHVELGGIPPVHHQGDDGYWLPEWRPWPGEEVILKIKRPQGIVGQTHTIDQVALALEPGKRITDTTLTLKLRSSRGGRHSLRLPEGATLQSVKINNLSQPIRQEGDQVTLPLTPGEQKIELILREAKGTALRFTSSLIDLGIKSVDLFITVTMPRDRWVLWADGPYVGPAVLFWSVAFVIVLLAFGIGRLEITPLKFHHWALLCLGLTQTSLLTPLPVVAWFFALGYRRKYGAGLSDRHFNLVQFALVLLSLFALAALLIGIGQGLLGYPNMQITGNGSGNYVLKWYQDRAPQVLPQAWVLSLPITVYRLLILAWAIWLAWAFLAWLRWAWQCFSADGLWRKGKKADKGIFSKEKKPEDPPPLPE